MMEKTFGRRPRGIWPSEGGLSERVVRILAGLGIAWTASDEHVLSRSLPRELERNARFEITAPQALYQPYRLPGCPLRIFFRDQLLSDLIGFYYQKFPAAEAAADLYRRIKDIARSSPEALTIPIILDGENAWEFYPRSGRDFLREFYRLLSLDDTIETVTFSQAADGPVLELARLKAGSWINANFDIWIGDREDQRAWELLKGARDAYTAAQAGPRPGTRRGHRRAAAHRPGQRLVLVVRPGELHSRYRGVRQPVPAEPDRDLSGPAAAGSRTADPAHCRRGARRAPEHRTAAGLPRRRHRRSDQRFFRMAGRRAHRHPFLRRSHEYRQPDREDPAFRF